ncbi:hypothetical protein H696_04885 [Fonticula alba]|uniref:Uncharacterized protein n=1 Tax=Fonticula alba TaxID=691883 RepID=A0A058Z3V4_FONAL|nr:hypothetical protein H696_04885 [Fonticula alba]KCV68593.1 hypothetical protein H696_04885 [Fonticula alba]|eukprot:XP_009497025.1 hypothetical protein H696_04885 [Fonticula alba]
MPNNSAFDDWLALLEVINELSAHGDPNNPSFNQATVFATGQLPTFAIDRAFNTMSHNSPEIQRDLMHYVFGHIKKPGQDPRDSLFSKIVLFFALRRMLDLRNPDTTLLITNHLQSDFQEIARQLCPPGVHVKLISECCRVFSQLCSHEKILSFHDILELDFALQCHNPQYQSRFIAVIAEKHSEFNKKIHAKHERQKAMREGYTRRPEGDTVENEFADIWDSVGSGLPADSSSVAGLRHQQDFLAGVLSENGHHGSPGGKAEFPAEHLDFLRSMKPGPPDGMANLPSNLHSYVLLKIPGQPE